MSLLHNIAPATVNASRLVSQIAAKRTYYSIYHVEPALTDQSKPENRILDKAYKEFVPKDGFTETAVRDAADALKISPSMLGAMFNFTTPSRDMAMELALYHLKYARQQMIDENKEEASKIFDEKQRLQFFMHKRLLLNEPIIHQYYQALGRMILPLNIPQSLKELNNLADDMSWYAGDKSTDFAWYSKRFSVAGAFVQSELFMLSDKSNGFKDTLQFSTDRLNEIATAGKIYNSFEEWALFNGISIINLVRSQLARG